MLNLLINAVKFSPANGTINVEISYTIIDGAGEDIQDSSKVLLSVIVQDDGPGISLEDQEKLFKPFEIIKNMSKINPNGVGLGLYVSKVICEKLKGDIACFSNGIGSGTTFEFRI